MSNQLQGSAELVVHYSNIRSLLHPLKAIVFNDKARICYAVFQADNRGIRVTVEQGKAAQAVACLESRNCDEYRKMGDDDIEFAVDLLALIRFLETGIFPHPTSISGAGAHCSPSLTLEYFPNDEKPLKVAISNQSTFTTRLNLKTISNCELHMDAVMAATTAAFAAKVILHCDALKEAFVDLDISSEYLTISTSSDPAYLRFSTTSRLSSGSVDFYSGSTTGNNPIVQFFSCTVQGSFKYKMSHFRAALRAMVFGRRVSIRLRTDGVLALQFQLPSHSGGYDDDYDESSHTFVDYLFRAVDDETNAF